MQKLFLVNIEVYRIEAHCNECVLKLTDKVTDIHAHTRMHACMHVHMYCNAMFSSTYVRCGFQNPQLQT